MRSEARASAAILLALVFGCSDGEPNWRERVLEDAYRPVHDDPEFLAMTDGLDPEDVDRLVASVRRRGLLRLDDALLLRRASVYRGALERADENICAILARGADPAERTNVGVLLVNELDRDGLEEWAEISALAILAELHQLPFSRPTSADATAALDSVFGALPEAEAGRMASAFADPHGAPDSEICWAGRTLYQTLETLPPEEKSALARVLAAG